jgi:site-specific recombinase XerD
MVRIIIDIPEGSIKKGKDIVIKVDEKGIGHITKDREKQKVDKNSLFTYMKNVITQLSQNGHNRTAETYTSTLHSFRKFRKNKDISMQNIDCMLIESYETFLRSGGVTMNSSSFYMRILRAVYNRAVDSELIFDSRPFRHVYTGVDKTLKRAIPISDISAIRSMAKIKKSMEYARDMFMFSFYTRGMSFVDMAFLKKTDIEYGFLTYRRKKTGQLLSIKWEQCMQDIIQRYPCDDSIYLLPIVNSTKDNERTQYRSRQRAINNNLKKIAKNLGLDCNLTMYVARHSWASAALEMEIPIEIISDGMGHTSEKTTRIYLKSMDNRRIDFANERIISAIE